MRSELTDTAVRLKPEERRPHSQDIWCGQLVGSASLEEVFR